MTALLEIDVGHHESDAHGRSDYSKKRCVIGLATRIACGRSVEISECTMIQAASHGAAYKEPDLGDENSPR